MDRTNKESESLVTCKGGLEAKLELSAWVILIIGLVLGVFALLHGSGGLLPAAIFAGCAWTAWLILKGLSESVRLLKRMNKLPYSG